MYIQTNKVYNVGIVPRTSSTVVNYSQFHIAHKIVSFVVK